MSHTDIKKNGWIARFLPEPLRPYAYLARLDRPIGIWLLLLPAIWSIALASGGIHAIALADLYLYMLFFIGAVIMRAAGCVINDLWDRKIDQKVERTKDRPLASGEITVRDASGFLAALLFAGLMVLLQMSFVAIMLGILSLPLIALYPLMKRITWWPQFFLGIVFNFGALMGWAATTGILSLPPLMLYAGCVFWTLGYDTIYAHQDKKDDALLGIKSTALKFGAASKQWVAGFYTVFFALLAGGFIAAGAGILSFSGLLLAAAYGASLVARWEPDNPKSSLDIFRQNAYLGALIFAAALI